MSSSLNLESDYLPLAFVQDVGAFQSVNITPPTLSPSFALLPGDSFQWRIRSGPFLNATQLLFASTMSPNVTNVFTPLGAGYYVIEFGVQSNCSDWGALGTMSYSINVHCQTWSNIEIYLPSVIPFSYSIVCSSFYISFFAVSVVFCLRSQ